MKHVPILSVSCVREGSAPTDKTLDCPGAVADLMRTLVGNDEREHFVVFMLDARSKVKSLSVVSVGTLSASLVHPRELFRAAIVAGAAAVIIAHNHPSGDPLPSPEDKATTERMQKAGRLIGIEVLDHVITGDGERFYSFRESGVL